MPPPQTPFTALRALSRTSRFLTTSSPRIASRFQPQPPALIRQLQPLSYNPKRFHSSTTTTTPTPAPTTTTTTKPPSPLTDRTTSPSSHKPKSTRPPQPEYQITFTCDPCKTRSTHKISKQGYHKGSVLIACPECKNRHVISDNLNIFGDKHITIEDLMKAKGELVKKGTLNADGDVEFWAEGEEGVERMDEQPVKGL